MMAFGAEDHEYLGLTVPWIRDLKREEAHPQGEAFSLWNSRIQGLFASNDDDS